MQHLDVTVTKEDISKGVPRSARRCPIALALKRHGYDKVRVGFSGIAIRREYRYRDDFAVVTFVPSYTVQHFITAFDGGREVKPFRMRLRQYRFYQDEYTSKEELDLNDFKRATK